MGNEDLKLSPYERLQSILSEKNAGKLTENASNKLDYLLNDKVGEPSFFDKIIGKIKSFFKKIDSLIFSDKSRGFNTTFYRRKKSKNKWT